MTIRCQHGEWDNPQSDAGLRTWIECQDPAEWNVDVTCPKGHDLNLQYCDRHKEGLLAPYTRFVCMRSEPGQPRRACSDFVDPVITERRI